jgi:hypothetical protein
MATLTIEDDRTILDLDLRVRLNHEQPSGVSISLTHDDGDARLLVDRSEVDCLGPGGIIFDDGAEVPSSQWCASGTTPLVQPEQSLSTYNELMIAGTWTVSAFDHNTAPEGSISEWCIDALLSD